MNRINDIARAIKQLPTLSEAVTKLARILDDPSAGATEFEAIIKPDLALTTNLLKLANSPYFGQRREIGSVRQAIALLGIRRVFELAASAAVRRTVPATLPGFEVDAQTYWQHSVAVAVLAERLARVCAGCGGKTPDMTFTAGLLHDVGKLVISTFLAEDPAGLRSLLGRGATLAGAERELLGTYHGEVGGHVVLLWGLPQRLGLVCRYHHVPSAPEAASEQNLVDLVHAANGLAHMLGLGADVGEMARTVDPAAVKRLGISTDRLEMVAGESLDEIESLSAAVGGER